MAVSKLELDRFTFDFIQKQLAENGYELAAGHLVNVAHDYCSSFTKKTVRIDVGFTGLCESDIQKLVDDINGAL